MSAATRLLVLGEFSWFSGSSHVIRAYANHGPALGIEVAVATRFGSRDGRISRLLPLCDDPGWATHALIIYEGNPFLSEADLAALDRVLPRSRRAVVDTDGHWAPTTVIGDDDNTWPCGAEAWRQQLAAAADLILQPRLVAPADGAVAFPYFGLPEPSLPRRRRSRPIALQYVGNNWFRAAALLDLFAAARRALGPAARLRVCGRGWDGTVRPGFAHATWADPAALADLGVEARPPVPFGTVVARMGQAALSPVLVRPVLSALQMLTPRMLETLSAATVPVYLQEDAYIGRLYGDEGALCLGAEPESAIGALFDQQEHLRERIETLRAQIARTYGYPAVLRHLRDLLG